MTEVGFEDDFPPHNFLKGLAYVQKDRGFSDSAPTWRTRGSLQNTNSMAGVFIPSNYYPL